MHRDKLEDQLREMPWVYEGKKALPGANRTMWDYYQNYWLPFGEVLTDMEREGIKVPPLLCASFLVLAGVHQLIVCRVVGRVVS
jgi:DNA polymerase-1